MILYPAIDLKDGKCVRLYKGEMDQATVFADDPAAQGKKFEAQGFRWLHLVDLNGAFVGKPVNRHAVESILKEVKLPMQLGGGIRDLATIDKWLEAGISRVILGTIAVKSPAIVMEACHLYPGQIAVGIDARDGMVATDGWAKASSISARELALKFEDAGVAAIIYTDIERDGTKQGANIEATAKLASELSTPLILSGGVAGIADIEAALEVDGIEGVILGRALYDGHIDPAAALALAGSA